MDKALTTVSVYKLVGQTISDLAAATVALNAAQKTGVGNAGELGAAQDDLSSKLGNELDHVGQVSKAYGVSMVGALNLLQVAGVSTSAIFTSQNKVWQAALVRGPGPDCRLQGHGHRTG